MVSSSKAVNKGKLGGGGGGGEGGGGGGEGGGEGGGTCLPKLSETIKSAITCVAITMSILKYIVPISSEEDSEVRVIQFS